jgi:hypothetical protein
LLERLTATDRNNVQDRIALADALSNTARLYVRKAGQGGEPATRVHAWTNARSFYLRSQELWMELGRAGKLPPARGRAIQDVNGELARCNDSLRSYRSSDSSDLILYGIAASGTSVTFSLRFSPLT